ncbi:MAG: chemotaxis protein CheA [Cyclobacteriaceae bacterium]
MENLHNIYLEEAEDLFSKIEESLLLLEKAPDDSSLIAEVFRSMHTLKGSSSMYGSNKVADFVHNLETIYDRVRGREIDLSQSIIDATFKSLDHLKKIVQSPDIPDPIDAIYHEKLTAEILGLLDESEGTDKITTQTHSAKRKTFLISFTPDKDVFINGTNPILLIDELTELGTAQVFTYMEKSLSSKKYDPKKCYTSWDVLLVADEDENPIKDVFIFVEETSKISVDKVFDGNLLSLPEFTSQLPPVDLQGKRLTLASVKKFISKVPKEVLESKEEENELMEIDVTEEVTVEETQKSQGSEESITSIRVSSDKLDELMNQVSELVTTQAGLSMYSENNFDPVLNAIADNVEKLSRQLRDIAFEMTLIQISNLFRRFNRVTRDISNQLGKAVKFVTEGGETELDKKIIDSLADPLMHLIRNSLDHGIESREERIKNGKPEKGTIKLSSYYSGAKVYIQIEDDGRGIDAEKIREKAITNRLISKDDKLSEKEIFDLIFVPGFSLAKSVTDISGRGVGMDVVKKNILDIRGDISVESKIGKGTKITLGLPLTLSVIDGLLVKVQETSFIVPLVDIKKCFEIRRDELSNDFNELIKLEDDKIPYLDLRKEFLIKNEDAPEKASIILLENENNRIAVCVDSIVGEYQAVLKPVGKYYRNQEFVSGATILGDGSIALVLDAYKIIARKIVKQKKSA